jgi:2,3-dihydroxybenzoate decarboxylase
VDRKIALEERYGSPGFPATESHDFTDTGYFADCQRQLREVDLEVPSG